MIRSHILSVLILSHKPNNISSLVKWNLLACVHLAFIWFSNEIQKSFVWVQFQKRCTMVSDDLLQNWHKSDCSGLNLDTDLFVVKQLWMILNCNHLRVVSCVVFANFSKQCLHWLRSPPVSCHFSIPLGRVSVWFKIL